VPAAFALVVAAASGCGTSVAGTASGSSSSTADASMGSSSMGGSPTTSASPGMAATKTVIMISSFAYRTPATVSPGQTIGIMNMDGEAHTVTADSANAFDVTAAPGTTATFTAPTTPGRYPFHCTFHSNMHGVLVVR
jgi:plastocyanin